MEAARAGEQGRGFAVVVQVRRVEQLVGEIGATTQAQAQGVGRATEAVGQLDHATQRNVALVGDSSAAASNLRQQTTKQTQVASAFKMA